MGHEEQHPLLRMDEAGMKEMLTVLSCARARVMCHGYFWTCWKVRAWQPPYRVRSQLRCFQCSHQGGASQLVGSIFPCGQCRML